MLVASVLLPTPPFGLATTITGMRCSSRWSMPGMLAAQRAVPGSAQTLLPVRPMRRPVPPDELHHGRYPGARSPTRDLRALARQRALLQAARAAAAQSPERVAVRDLYALYPDYLIDVRPSRRRSPQRPAGRLAASDPLVRHAAADEALARRGARLRLGLRPAAAPRCAARTSGWWPPPAAPRQLVPARRLQPLLLRRLPAALRADRGAVRHALPAAAGAARRAPRRARPSSTAHVAALRASALRSYPDWPEIADLKPCIECEVPAGDAAVAGRPPRRPRLQWSG